MGNPFRKIFMDKKQNQHQTDDDTCSVTSVSSAPAQTLTHSPSYEAHVPSPEGSPRRAVKQQVKDNQNSEGVQELGNFKLDKSAAIALLEGGISQRVVGNINEGQTQRIANFESYNGLAQSRMTSEHNHNCNNLHPPTTHPYAAPRPSHGQPRLVLEVNAIGNTNLNGKQSGGNVRAAALPTRGRFVVNANGNHNEGELQDVGNIDINFGARQ